MTLIKNKKFIAFTLVCILGFLLYILFVFYSTSLFPRTTIKFLNSGRFSTVNPGKTTTKELNSKFGKPVDEETKDSVNTLFYNSYQQYQLDNVWTKDGKVIATREIIIDKTTKDAVVRELGQPEEKFFDAEVIPASWWVYLNKGVAFQIGDDGVVYSLIRFAPQSRESFLQNVAPFAGITTKKFNESETIDLP